MVVFFLTAIILPVKTSVKTVVKNEDDFEKNVEDISTAAAELLHRIQKHPHRIICEEFMDEK